MSTRAHTTKQQDPNLKSRGNFLLLQIKATAFALPEDKARKPTRASQARCFVRLAERIWALQTPAKAGLEGEVRCAIQLDVHFQTSFDLRRFRLWRGCLEFDEGPLARRPSGVFRTPRTQMPPVPNPKDAQRRQRRAFGLSRALARKPRFGIGEVARICRPSLRQHVKPRRHMLGPLVGGGVAREECGDVSSAFFGRLRAPARPF